ncbi:MAG: TIR domain-containing protein [Candidatus Omnitrophota bacterium]
MPIAYLAHSSKDKNYVSEIAKILGKNRCVYDKFTFEEGMKNIEEIDKGLEKTDLFVVFLSSDALDSEWVKIELERAKKLANSGFLKRIYPIIIDPSINYLDKRIPLWMREESFNLQYTGKPKVAVRRIELRLREISWDFHPRLFEKSNIFVGRNDLIKIFEERFDSLDLPSPVCFIAAGFHQIGRRSLCIHCLKKANVIPLSYRPPEIALGRRESIEDFIYQIYDLGFSSDIDLSNLINKKMEDKVKISLRLIKDIQIAKHILLIVDNGCIVTSDRIISNWFVDILNEMNKDNQITFVIVSQFRIFKHNFRNLEHLFTIEVPELSITERLGLLKRYAELEKLPLSSEDLNYFRDLLNGYPEQIFYTVDLINEIGLPAVKKNTYLIVDFNTEKAARVINKYESNKRALDFLYLLSIFPFIGYDLIFEIVGEDKFYRDLLSEFFASGICELLGANREYVRLNDTIQDYVIRNKKDLTSVYQEKLETHVNKFLNEYQSEDKDVADLIFSIKTAILTGKPVDPRFLIPSHFLEAMAELYHRRKRYEDVVKLADRVLVNEGYMDDCIKKETRYFLCASLARLRDPRFLSEVQKVTGLQHDFLFGFYYRLSGNGVKAIERLTKVLSIDSKHRAAKRELVQAYIHTSQYEKATDLAEENYQLEKDNPFHVQAFFDCLIKNEKRKPETVKKLEQLLRSTKLIKSDKGEEIDFYLRAQFEAFINNKKESALQILEEGIAKFTNAIYFELAKFDIYETFNDIEGMQSAINVLDSKINEKSYHYNSLIKREAVLFAKQGFLDKALDLINKKLRNMPEEALIAIASKIKKVYGESNY